MKDKTVLIVEDNPTMRLGMAESLRREGYQVAEFSDGPGALEYLRGNSVFLAIVDLKMEPLNGIEVLRRIREMSPSTEVLMVSAYGTVDTAVEAMKLGAADFLTKPFSTEELRIRVKKVREKIEKDARLQRLVEENRMLQDEIETQFDEMVGNSPAIQEIYRIIERVAAEDSTVLIEGESGTGKELVARAIHRKSPRADKPFIKVNCGALNENLLESELFGHEKGAFTGAIRQKKGRFELADGGTLFLDEIGEISPAMQVKLLQVLQEKTFERVGGETTLAVDVRIISATNRNLQKRVLEGKFREDLYYRLSVIPIKLPALRERREDIPALVAHFLNRLARKRGEPPRSISPDGLSLLQQYPWPGNIRELENLLERLWVISPEEEIPTGLIARHLGNQPRFHLNYENLPLQDALYNFEKNLLLHALQKAEGNKQQAARLLKIKTSTLYYKLEKYGLMK